MVQQGVIMKVCLFKPNKKWCETKIYINADSGLNIQVCRYSYQTKHDIFRYIRIIDFENNVNTTLNVLKTAHEVIEKLIKRGYVYKWTMSC
jgi:hypothetical protein